MVFGNLGHRSKSLKNNNSLFNSEVLFLDHLLQSGHHALEVSDQPAAERQLLYQLLVVVPETFVERLQILSLWIELEARGQLLEDKVLCLVACQLVPELHVESVFEDRGHVVEDQLRHFAFEELGDGLHRAAAQDVGLVVAQQRHRNLHRNSRMESSIIVKMNFVFRLHNDNISGLHYWTL